MVYFTVTNERSLISDSVIDGGMKLPLTSEIIVTERRLEAYEKNYLMIAMRRNHRQRLYE